MNALTIDVPEITRLPALIDRATQRLADARTSAEVLEAKHIAEAALHYARITKAANETHADCLRIIIRAETRIAIEIDEGQARGDVATRGNPNVRGADNSEVQLDDLGVSRQRLSEWRETRDAGAGVVEDAIRSALADGRAPTKADVKRAVDGKPHVSNNSGNNEWYTPPEFIKAAREAMGAIDVDPASSAVANRTVGAATFYNVDDDGLTKPWRGNVWMNPPYAQPLIAQFCEAVGAKYDAKEIKRACVLVNNATETAWFQRLLDSASAVCFPQGRVKFHDADGYPSGMPLQGQAIVYMGESPFRFARAFHEFGEVLMVDEDTRQ